MAIRFDDIDAINASISDEFSDWGPDFEMTQDKVNQFAELTGDHQWIHVDIERANAGPFGCPIAHGFFTLSLMASIVKFPAQLEGASNGVNYGANKLRFLSPVPVPSDASWQVAHHPCRAERSGHADHQRGRDSRGRQR